MPIRQSLLAILLMAACHAATLHAQAPPTPRPIDARRAAAAGIRILDGRYIQLATDLPSSPAVDELPALFDAAVPLWVDYFNVPAEKLAGQRWTACLIDQRDRFAALGLLPDDNPDFINGYSRGDRLWLVEQPSDYYRRHLLLHEGTHAFMHTLLGGAGPGWYMEGMAELLGTHRWQDGRLQLSVIPLNRDAVPMWGRTKLIRDAVAAGKPWTLERVLAVDNNRALEVEYYAWTWALTALLDGHPQYRDRFRELSRHAADPDFNKRFRQTFADDWDQLLADWAAYIPQLDYGYDVARMALVERDEIAVAATPLTATIAADRGWQSTGWRLKAGVTYRLAATGRYQIAKDEDGQPWPCEPGGITIQYREGQPLGILLAALHPGADGAGSFTKPIPIGLAATITPAQDALLYLRVNDSPANLADNAGELNVRIEAE